MNRPSDELDDVTLPQRPRRPDPRGEMRSESRVEMRSSTRDDLRDDLPSRDREFTLSTGTVLALFFGLALVCAVFFGFGYSMGRKSAVAAAPIADAAGSDASDSVAAGTGTANKPSAGSPAIQAIPGYMSQKEADSANKPASSPAVKPLPAAAANSVTLPLDATTAVKPKKPAPDPDGQIVEAPRTAPVRPVATASTAAASGETASAVPAISATGTNYVQVAAVSHKEDADVLLSALRRRGYTVLTRSSDTDKLIHVQVGPFASKKDAEAMRQKLLGDGYNAIVK